jgi:hypothetical protein
LGEVARSGHATADCLLAMGLLGDLSAVRVLHDCLMKPDLAPSAAHALELITGAKVYRDVFVPDEVVEDELFEEELIAWKERGQRPTHPDGRPFGATVKRLMQGPEEWRAWLCAHSDDFDSNYRYRNGKRYEPGTLLENLVDDKSPHHVRQLAFDELTIRYGCDLPFEADMPVVEQLRMLRDIADWINANKSRFQPGLWYFAGHPV